MYTLILLLLAIAPPMMFFAYLIKTDRVEPEPLGMLMFALALGVISTFPASLIEGLLAYLPFFGEHDLPAIIRTSFIQVAPVEEGCKLAVILLFVWKNRNFNEENDGIVYVTASSIGFALFENVLYVLSGGLATAVARSITAIPLHTFCGVIMGAYVGRARFAADRRTAAVLVLKGFAAAVFIHGLYDTFAMEHGSSSVVMLLLLVAALFFAGRYFFKTGKELSAARWANPEAAAQIRLDTASQQAARIVVRYGEDKIGIDAEGRFYLKPEKQTWKLVTGRLLYVFSFACWVLFLVVGYNASDEAALAAVFYFCLTMTCVPTVLAVLLTRSYRQRLESNTYL